MSASREALIDCAIDAEEQVAYALLGLAESDWLALDLTLTQLKAVMVLVAVGSLPIHQLAETLHLGARRRARSSTSSCGLSWPHGRRTQPTAVALW